MSSIRKQVAELKIVSDPVFEIVTERKKTNSGKLQFEDMREAVEFCRQELTIKKRGQDAADAAREAVNKYVLLEASGQKMIDARRDMEQAVDIIAALKLMYRKSPAAVSFLEIQKAEMLKRSDVMLDALSDEADKWRLIYGKRDGRAAAGDLLEELGKAMGEATMNLGKHGRTFVYLSTIRLLEGLKSNWIYKESEPFISLAARSVLFGEGDAKVRKTSWAEAHGANV
ncbi:MAG: hypothetical protein KGH57_02595 [Candidatus Micrarchaeota archaeon]|nr:hypothetical protein [Candidatus Micrarchaeota archaeon]